MNYTNHLQAMLDSVEPQMRGKYPTATEDFIKVESERNRGIIFSMIISLFCRYMKTNKIHPAIVAKPDTHHKSQFRKPEAKRIKIKYFHSQKAS